MKLRPLIRRARRYRAELVFAGMATLAVCMSAPAVVEGLPRFLSALVPGMAAQAEPTPHQRMVRLSLFGLPASRYAPQILYPVPENAFPDWLKRGPSKPVAAGEPVIAICIDDLGEDLVGTQKAMKLPREVALSFLPYAETTPFLAAEAKAQGHTVLAHIPMQAISATDPGPMALTVGMDRDEVLRRLYWSLDRVPGLSGINNHEGSRFTADAAALVPVMETLNARHLFFFDSRTSPASQGLTSARAAGVESAGRDIFLDDDMRAPAVKAALDALVVAARHQGVAIAIGHPHAATLALLAAWLKQDHGVKLVPLERAIRLKADHGEALALR